MENVSVFQDIYRKVRFVYATVWQATESATLAI